MKQFKDYYRQIREYRPYNEREEADQALILSLMDTYPNIYERSNLAAHMTASCWITNQKRDKVLMAYHNLFDSFAWLGGHADGNQNLLEAAITEAMEESSLNEVQPVSDEIYSLEVLTVDGHIKNGVYVPSHLHCNVTFLLVADDTLKVKAKPDENSAVSWFDVNGVLGNVNEEWMVKNVYQKLLEKMK